MNFIRLSESPEGRRKQAETLRQIVGLDFTALDTEKASLYSEREQLGRDLKNFKGQLVALPFQGETPEAEVSAAELMTELKKAQDHNAAIAEQEKMISDIKDSIGESEADIKRIASDIAELEKQLVAKKKILHDEGAELNLKRSLLETESEALAKMQRQDTTAIETQITEADGINKKVRDNATRRVAEKKVRDTDHRIEVLTQQMSEIDEEKRTKLAAAPFPVPGLSFDDSGILLEGVPFSQGSQAEQLVAATAIALALKPRIRVVLLRDASLLDKNTLQKVAKLAHRESAQIWLEEVDSADETAIHIQDGAVKKSE